MRSARLDKSEKAIERSLIRGEFAPVGRMEFERIAKSLAMRKKDAVINIRVNKKDLEIIKRKARRYGVGYQTLLSELIHRAAA